MLQFGTVEAIVRQNEPSLRGVYVMRVIVSDMLEGDLREAAELVANAKYLIALTGAGVSKESNVPTFRGEDGLWRNYNAMELATPSAFANNPKLVWEWYTWRQGLIAKCEPNPGHPQITNHSKRRWPSSACWV
jgi:NAD-dependent SIR2 family protein deacetylase